MQVSDTPEAKILFVPKIAQHLKASPGLLGGSISAAFANGYFILTWFRQSILDITEISGAFCPFPFPTTKQLGSNLDTIIVGKCSTTLCFECNHY